ncbi:MAG: hypothetical protein R3F56_19285 [Planctomycetota bacterium]
MRFSPPPLDTPADELDVRLTDDPWSLTPAERQDLRQRHEADQRQWLPRVRGLVEPPAPRDSFPAFLLAIAPFAHIGRAIGAARDPGELDVGTADELQRFVDRYRAYLADTSA